MFLLTWVGGVSLPALGAGGLVVVARRRSGVVLGRTGASSDRELGRARIAQHWTLHPIALPAQPHWAAHEGGTVEGVHLQGDGEFWLCRNSVLSSARSLGPGGPLPSFRQTGSSCILVSVRATPGTSSCTGSGAPRRLGSCRDSLYSSEKLLGGGRDSFRLEQPRPQQLHHQLHSQQSRRLAFRRRALQTPYQ